MAYVYQSKNKNGSVHRRWRFQFTDYMGHRRTGTGTTSKCETRKLAERVQAEHDEIRKGYRPVPHPWDKHRSREVSEVAGEYLAWGKSQGGRNGRPWGAGHARMRESLITWWQECLDLKTLADLDGVLPRVEKVLRELKEKKRSGKTLTNYAECLRGFGNWCATRGYLGEDPLKGLAAFDATPRTKRRALTKDELCRLLNAAPEHRRLLYSVAVCSGLRAGELRALTTNDLDTVNHGLRLHAEWTKNRKTGFQPLPASLVESLSEFARSGVAKKLYEKLPPVDNPKTLHPDNPLLFVSRDPTRPLYTDLAAADILQCTAEGKVDFHALRVAFITFVIEAGATVKEAQVLARHVTPNLTLDLYARIRESRLIEVAQALGHNILPAGNITGAQRRTGTRVSARS
ncbi:MAG: site-specific integrase, partial [Candidatus Hydrogenedentes bacterium]|nr:site-specific integrase [Candidatus Hydrogenedentota bacterium]